MPHIVVPVPTVQVKLSRVIAADLEYLASQTAEPSGPFERAHGAIDASQFAAEIVDSYVAEKRLPYVAAGLRSKETIEKFLSRHGLLPKAV